MTPGRRGGRTGALQVLPPRLNDPRDLLLEIIKVERLVHEVVGTVQRRGHLVDLLADGGEHDDADVGQIGAAAQLARHYRDQEGLTIAEIGRRLGISSETVRTHLRKACDRLGAATRTQAVATALRLGLIT